MIVAIYVTVGLVITCWVLFVGREHLWPCGWGGLLNDRGWEDFHVLLIFGIPSVALWPVYPVLIACGPVVRLLSWRRGLPRPAEPAERSP